MSDSSKSNGKYYNINDFTTSDFPSIIQKGKILDFDQQISFETTIHMQTDSKKNVSKNALDIVAMWFLSKKAMTNKKLQKLCYYAYAWYIVMNNEPETDEPQIISISPEHFQAWVHGPVSPSLYKKYRQFGWNEIPQEKETIIIDSKLEDLLNQVWQAYGELEADDLETLSHNETPWKEARKGYTAQDFCVNDISNKEILVYYSNLL